MGAFSFTNHPARTLFIPTFQSLEHFLAQCRGHFVQRFDRLGEIEEEYQSLKLVDDEGFEPVGRHVENAIDLPTRGEQL